MPSQLARRRAPVDPEMDAGDYHMDDEEEEQERATAHRRTPPWAGEDEAEKAAERPARARRSSARDEPEEKPTASVGRGWETLKDQRAKKSGNAHRLQVKDKEVLLHFLEEEPFAVYQQHWVGQRSYSCPGSKCPLCDAGYDTRTLALFNVIDARSAESMFWEAGPNAAKAIIDASEKRISSPINREDLYFAVNRDKQSNGFFAFTLTPVKERDLADDYEIEPLTSEEIEEAMQNLFDESVVPYHSVRELRAVADGDDED